MPVSTSHFEFRKFCLVLFHKLQCTSEQPNGKLFIIFMLRQERDCILTHFAVKLVHSNSPKVFCRMDLPPRAHCKALPKLTRTTFRCCCCTGDVIRQGFKTRTLRTVRRDILQMAMCEANAMHREVVAHVVDFVTPSLMDHLLVHVHIMVAIDIISGDVMRDPSDEVVEPSDVEAVHIVTHEHFAGAFRLIPQLVESKINDVTVEHQGVQLLVLRTSSHALK